VARTLRQDPVDVGDWIKLLNDNGGSDVAIGHIRTSGLAKVRRQGRPGGNMIVNLVTESGDVVVEGYYVSHETNSWERLDEPPEVTPVLAHIPNTAEVQAFKDILYQSVLEAADRNGYRSSVEEALKELGIEKPGVGRVSGTLTFTFDVPVDKVMSGTTDKTFAAAFERVSGRSKAAALAAVVESKDVKVEYEVKPYAPVIVPSPTTQSAAAESK
jgi:hypothetical protein